MFEPCRAHHKTKQQTLTDMRRGDALVNTVNTVGVMGKGIALQFGQGFPDNYDAYVRAREHGEVQPSHMFVFHRLTHPRWIINFPTKRDWRHRARMADIESGLKGLFETVKHEEIKSIAVPPLGCGNGGLDWSEVRRAQRCAGRR
jgi:O-acetyl-ADP-ribose deacetylase (regulator of RNase III)